MEPCSSIAHLENDLTVLYIHPIAQFTFDENRIYLTSTTVKVHFQQPG